MLLATGFSAALGFALLTGTAGDAADSARKPLDIRVASDGWGDADPEDIRAVLRSAGEALMDQLPEVQLPPIEVSRSRKGPITLYQRGPKGEFQVRLDSEGRSWAQFAFQFGHELCHVVAGCVEAPNPDLWFEESLCEAASLYVLGRMAERWKDRPPYPNWKSFAPALQNYRDERLSQQRLPEGTSLADWFREKEAVLRKDPHQRDLNRVVASVLLPALEAAPEHWGAVPFLNTVRGDATRGFPRYLGDWARSAPERHRVFIASVASRFGATAER